MAMWFERFMKDTIGAWDKSGLRVRENPKTMTEKPTEAQAADIGRAGEQFVAARLKRMGYRADLTGARRSPADVWGISVRTNGVVHIPLVQVKTTAGFGAPAALDASDEVDLTRLTEFVADRIREREDRSSVMLNTEWVVSAGYAGVHLLPGDRAGARGFVTTLVTAHALARRCSTGLVERNARRFAEEFHKLSG